MGPRDIHRRWPEKEWNVATLTEHGQYHIPKEAAQAVEDRIRQASRQELEKWANDPRCFEKGLCVQEIAARGADRERRETERPPTRLKDPEERRPFDPRTDISADAKHIASRIVKHLWIIFVLLPFVAVLLLAMAGVIK
jgi:hypothetical protein